MWDLSQWVDKKTIQTIATAVIAGLIAASIRAFSEKDSPRAFVIRLFMGAGMAGFVAYLLGDMDIHKVAYGLIIWFAGWGGGEVAAMLASIGKENAQAALGVDDNDTKDTDDGSEPDNQPEHKPNS